MASFTSTVVVAVVTFATVGVCVKNGKILFPENIEIELKVFLKGVYIIYVCMHVLF